MESIKLNRIIYTYLVQSYLLHYEHDYEYDYLSIIDSIKESHNEIYIPDSISNFEREDIFIWASQLIIFKYPEFLRIHLKNKPELTSIFNELANNLLAQNIDWLIDIDTLTYNRLTNESYLKLFNFINIEYERSSKSITKKSDDSLTFLDDYKFDIDQNLEELKEHDNSEEKKYDKWDD